MTKRKGSGFLVLLMLFSMFSLVSIAQIKKPVKSGTPGSSAPVVNPLKDGLTLNLKAVMDTAKVRVIAYMQDSEGVNTLTWLDGYVVTVSFVPRTTDAFTKDFRLPSNTVSVFDKQWQSIEGENIFDVKKIEWVDLPPKK